VRALIIEAAQTSLCSARKVEIVGLSQADATKFAETLIVNFMRTTAGNVTVTWSES
jgi:hypothetical protein